MTAVIRLAAPAASAAEAHQPVRDLDQIRAFLTGAGPIAIVDLPWMPIFLAHLLPHSSLARRGCRSIGAVILLTHDAADRAREPRPDRSRSRRTPAARATMVEAHAPQQRDHRRDGHGRRRWRSAGSRSTTAIIAARRSASDVAGSYGSVSKVLRLLLQSVDARARRLSRDPAGTDRRRHDRRFDHDGPGAGADRDRDRQLARVHRRASIASTRLSEHARAAAGPSATRTDAAAAGAQPRRRACHRRGAGQHNADRRQRALRACEQARRWPSSARAAPARPRWYARSIGVWRPARGERPARRRRPRPMGRGRSSASTSASCSQTIELFDGTIAENIARMSVKPDADAVLRGRPGRAARTT